MCEKKLSTLPDIEKSSWLLWINQNLMTANLGAVTHQTAKKIPMEFQKYPITQMSKTDENNSHAPHAQILDYCTKALSTKVEISCWQMLGAPFHREVHSLVVSMRETWLLGPVSPRMYACPQTLWTAVTHSRVGHKIGQPWPGTVSWVVRE